jgi:4-hydroxybenzoate polyprenyltransferase
VPVANELPGQSTVLPLTWARAVRVHQWAKNLLLVLPALAAHLGPAPEVLGALVLAFFSFSLLASAV